MSYRLFVWLLDGLFPIIPALFLIQSDPALTLIRPWPIIGSLLGAHLLVAALAWRHIGSTPRQRKMEALMLAVSAFVPLATFEWVFSADGNPISLPVQILIYCLGQMIWIASVEIAPCWMGRRRQHRAEESALSGKQAFLSREAAIREHEKTK